MRIFFIICSYRDFERKLFVTLILVAIASLFLFSSSFPAIASSPGAIPVYTAKIFKMTFEDSLILQGSVESANIARVSPRIPGPIEQIFVKEGERVYAGKTKLFVIDPLKLQTNVEIRKQDLAIAGFSLKEKSARQKQAEADLEKSKVDLARVSQLWEKDSASQDTYEKAQLKYKVSEATFEHILTIIELEKEQLKKAEMALRLAEKDLEDSTIYAPLTGVVSNKLQEPGEIAAPGKPIIIIKDTDDTEIIAYAPAEHYYRIIAGQTKAIATGYAGISYDAIVTYKSPEILPALRTFEIRCKLKDVNATMVPGGLAEVSLILDSSEGLAINANAIVRRGGKLNIFKAENGKALMIPVETGLTNNSYIQISSDRLKEGDEIVIQGQSMLNDGQAIKVLQGGSH